MDFIGAFLKVNDGCYVRSRDVSVVGTGMRDAEDGSDIAPLNTVIVHMMNGTWATFVPCAGEDEAKDQARQLVAELAARDTRGLS